MKEICTFFLKDKNKKIILFGLNLYKFYFVNVMCEYEK